MSNEKPSLGPIVGNLSFRLDLREECGRKCLHHHEGFVLHQCPVEGLAAVTGNGSSELTKKTYCLSIPEDDYFLFFHAYRDKAIVQIDRYELFSVAVSDQDTLRFLCVHPNGTKIILPTLKKSPTNRPYLPEPSEIWTLQELAALEVADERQKNRSTDESFTFKATVLALSPILKMDPREPFLLLEMAQFRDKEDPLNCVVVVRGDALVLHHCLVPGQQLILHRVKRKKWRVPEIIERRDVPTRVFLLNSVENVFLEPKTLPLKTSTTHSVLEGRILSISSSNRAAKLKDVVEMDVSGKHVCLFITNFPLEMSLGLFLRPGCTIGVYNSEGLEDGIIFASLRSSISIRSHGPFSSHHINFLVETCPTSSFSYSSNMSYFSVYLRYELEKWLRSVDSDGILAESVLSAEVIANTFNRKHTLNWNAYKSFFSNESTAFPNNGKKFCPVHISTVEQIVRSSIHLCTVPLGDKMSSLQFKAKIGWSSSLVFPMRGRDRNEPTKLVFGSVRYTSPVSSRRHFHLDGVSFSIPVILSDVESIVEGNILLKVDTLVVNVVYVGETEISFDPSFLPSSSNQRQSQTCVLNIGGSLFAATMFLLCNHMVSPSTLEAEGYEPKLHHFLSCDAINARNISSTVVTRLVRKNFKISKPRDGKYGSMSLVLSDFGKNIEDSSCVQNVDVRPLVSLGEGSIHDIFRFILHRCGLRLEDEQLTLIRLWQTVGSLPEQCALLAGGWEENARMIPSFEVRVVLPDAAFSIDERRGFSRVRCRLSDLVASPVRKEIGLGLFSTVNPSTLIFGSGPKVLSGSLDMNTFRVSKRKGISSPLGELLYPIKSTIVPFFSIQDIANAVCGDVRNNRRLKMAPSLVRSIKNARFLGISYCSAVPQCMKCYSLLRESDKDQDKIGKRDVKSSSDLYHEVIENQANFWGSPSNKRKRLSPPSIGVFSKRRHGLVCPEGCSVEDYGTIKWECSGTIDDGTGQAKLFAERDAAVALLNLSKSDVEFVEAGAWTRAEGIVYNRSMPPPSYLKGAIQSAKMLAFEKRGRNAGPLSESEIFHFLTAHTKAEYILNRHCRFSREPLRELVYLVRCKPLSDESNCLSKTEIELVKAGPDGEALTKSTLSYTLPALKMNLVDIQRPDYASFENDSHKLLCKYGK